MRETEKWVIYEQEDFDKDIIILVEKLRLIIGRISKEELKATVRGKQIILPLPFKIDGIFAPMVGGNVPATYLHYRLKLPYLAAPTGNSLVFDDIVDKGDQLVHYAKKGNLIVSLFYNRKSIVEPHIWLHEKLEKWIHFPWEDPEDGDDN